MSFAPSRRTLLGMIGGGLAVLPAAAFATGAGPEVVAITTAGGRISRVLHWRATRRRGTILFSHGALSSPRNYDALLLPWVMAGYDVWAPTHVDSPDHPETKNFPGLLSWRARIEDMRALSRHVGHGPRIAAGHSYGGLVALTLGGARAEVPDGLTGPLDDPLVRAVVAFSPPAPVAGLVSRDGYATVAVPALIETGTLDLPPGAPAGSDAWRGHLTAFDRAAPGGHRYALILEGVDHLFGGAICYLDRPGPRQTAQLAVAGDLSRQFLDAFGRHQPRARRALDARLTATGPARLFVR